MEAAARPDMGRGPGEPMPAGEATAAAPTGTLYRSTGSVPKGGDVMNPGWSEEVPRPLPPDRLVPVTVWTVLVVIAGVAVLVPSLRDLPGVVRTADTEFWL